jgi:probable HAF family extracellular repeat protein
MHVLLRAAIRFSLWAAPVVCGSIAVRPVCAQISFTPASELPGGGFRGTPYAISGDGSTVVGETGSANGREAFRWSADSGMTLLGDFPGGRFYSAAYGVSHDGSVIVGYGNIAPIGYGDIGNRAFRWTRNGGMIDFGVVAGRFPATGAFGVSADGSIVVGHDGNYFFPGRIAFRWTDEEGATPVGQVATWANSVAGDVSADGRVIVGEFDDEAFRWTADNGMVLLGPRTSAYRVSADGSTVAGRGPNGAAIWTAADGWVDVAQSGFAWGVSGDGSTAVGFGVGGAFVWTRSAGHLNLREYLLSNGLTELENWTLASAQDISDDGRTIVGYGTNPLGQTEAWVATIPEPSTFVLFAAAVVAFGARRIRSRSVVHHCLLVAVVLNAAAVDQLVAAQYSFTPASELPGGGFNGIAEAISGDGSVIVGRGFGENRAEAFRWTATDGVTSLGYLPGGGSVSGALGVSDDGSVVVGYSDDQWRVFGPQAFRWTAESGMTALGTRGGEFGASARAASASGLVVVGYDGGRGFRWNAAEGLQTLGSGNNATDISADGAVVVGTSYVAGGSRAFRWTATDGLVVLRENSYASAVSADGAAVVGGDASARQAFRWTASGGWQLLGRLPGIESSAAEAISADGSLIVGDSNKAAEDGAFLWTSDSGMLNFREFLIARGLTELADWQLTSVEDISADGRTILGHGTNPSGQRESWIATIPEPTSVVLSACALLALLVAYGGVRNVVN